MHIARCRVAVGALLMLGHRPTVINTAPFTAGQLNMGH
jgi:hypothetical protein